MTRPPRRHYTNDQKAQAFILSESVGPTAAARQLNVSVNPLANWLTASRAGQPLRSPARQPASTPQLVRLATVRQIRGTLSKRYQSI